MGHGEKGSTHGGKQVGSGRGMRGGMQYSTQYRVGIYWNVGLGRQLEAMRNQSPPDRLRAVKSDRIDAHAKPSSGFAT